MEDVLIPLGLLAFIGLFAYALISTGRKQRAAKRRMFRDFAETEGLSYLVVDDGRAQRFAQDMDGIGQFRSASFGKAIPQDVVSGEVGGRDVVLFHHHTRFYEGHAQEWFVAGVSMNADIAERFSIQFLKPGAAIDSMHLVDPIAHERDLESFHVVIRAPNADAAGQALNELVLQRLARIARSLPVRPEIQVRRNCLAVYGAERNTEISATGGLRALLDYAQSACEVLT